MTNYLSTTSFRSEKIDSTIAGVEVEIWSWSDPSGALSWGWGVGTKKLESSLSGGGHGTRDEAIGAARKAVRKVARMIAA